MRRVKCKSGCIGWQERLQKVYDDFDEWQRYSDCYGLAYKLGYKNASTAWKANPIVQGSSIPSDYRKVKKNGSRRRK